MTNFNSENLQGPGPTLQASSDGPNDVSSHDVTIDARTELTPSADSSRQLYRLSPINDPRWAEFLSRSSEASLFHSAPWLEALRRTYGYEPVVVTTSSPSQRLENGLVFCRVESRLTGRRLVSVPFSDYCQPLANGADDLRVLLGALQDEVSAKGLRYFEIRPLIPISVSSPNWHTAAVYLHHQIDLKPDLPTLYGNCHRDSVQRKIRRAEREGLTLNVGATESLLDSFYELMVKTRRRHGVPPQPKQWFRALMDSFGEALQIRIALNGAKPIAGMLTIRYKDTLVYKYGGSDVLYNNLGSMHLLYWSSIQDGKKWGLHSFDLGRTDAHQTGLATFKRRWGAVESAISYARYTTIGDWIHSFEPARSTWRTQVAKFLFSHTPNKFLPILGNLLYKHFG